MTTAKPPLGCELPVRGLSDSRRLYPARTAFPGRSRSAWPGPSFRTSDSGNRNTPSRCLPSAKKAVSNRQPFSLKARSTPPIKRTAMSWLGTRVAERRREIVVVDTPLALASSACDTPRSESACLSRPGSKRIAFPLITSLLKRMETAYGYAGGLSDGWDQSDVARRSGRIVR